MMMLVAEGSRVCRHSVPAVTVREELAAGADPNARDNFSPLVLTSHMGSVAGIRTKYPRRLFARMRTDKR